MTDALIIFVSCFVASLATSALWLFLNRSASKRALQEDRSQLANRENIPFHTEDM